MWRRTEINQGYINGMGQYRGSYFQVFTVGGHYELFIDGNFWSSGDSRREIEDELEWISSIGEGPF